jgi:HK97 family phage portal protein
MLAAALDTFLPGRRAADYGPLSDFWYRPVGSPSAAGVDVRPDNAMGVSAVFACVRLLAEIFGSLDFTVRRFTETVSEAAPDHYLYDTLFRRPNRWQTRIEWGEMGMAHVCLRGNFVNRIVLNEEGQVELLPLNPDRITYDLLPNRTLRYTYRPQSGQQETLSAGDVLHVRGLSLDGIRGVSVLEYAKHAVGAAIAQGTYGASLFRNGGLPAFWISRPTGSKFTPDARRNFRSGWRKIHGGPENAGNPPILEDGMEIHELGLTSRDSQWIESREFEAVEICRFFRVPPHMIGIPDEGSGKSIEQKAIEFVRFTLFPWGKRWTQAMDRDLVDDPKNYRTHVDLDQVQQGDKLSRYQAYNIGIQGGWILPNEARRQENLPPVEGGDTARFPTNMQPAGGGPDWNEQGGQPGKGKPKGQKNGGPQDAGDDGGDADEGPTAFEQRREKRKQEKAAKRKKKAAAAFAPLLADAAARIAAAEIRGLSARADKAAADRRTWCSWLQDEFYPAHCQYAARVLAPLADAWRKQTGTAVDAEAAAVTTYRHTHALFHTDKDVPTVLNGWKTTRAAELLGVLQQAFTA